MVKYSYQHPNLIIRESRPKGAGLFSTGEIKIGELLIVTGGRILPVEELAHYDMPGHPFQVEKDWIMAPFDLKNLDGIFLVNHSCSPNAGISGQCSLVATRDIFPEEEICFDYCMTDSDPNGIETFSMECLCGSSTCRKRISDLDWRNEALQIKYDGFFSSYLKKRIEEEKNLSDLKIKNSA